MTHGSFIRKLMLGGIICLLIVAGACYFWYKHSIAPYEKESEQTVKTINEWKESQKVNTNNVTEEVTTTAAESRLATAEKPITQTTDVPGNVSENINISNIETGASPTETAEGVRVSPYGFGPYPELPEGWSDKTWNTRSANSELITRVLVKLWHQGEIRTKSGAMEDGLVYPIVPGTLYVKWDTYNGPFGSVRYICDSLGHPADDPRLEAISKEKRERRARPSSLTREDIPSDIELVPFSEGINPYTFLDLP